MKPKDRIAQLERELAEVREELEAHERAEELENELKALLAKLAIKRVTRPSPPPVIYSGWWCSCGQWVTSGSYHVCVRPWAPRPQPYWVTPPTFSGSYSQSSPVIQGINTNTGHLQLVTKNDEGPPDMGVIAKTG